MVREDPLHQHLQNIGLKSSAKGGQKFRNLSNLRELIDRRTLVISAPGAAATLITSANRTIIERLNAHFGKEYIHRIRVLQTKLRKAR